LTGNSLVAIPDGISALSGIGSGLRLRLGVSPPCWLHFPVCVCRMTNLRCFRMNGIVVWQNARLECERLDVHS
jgi:hypothetical protein